jgi:hypothetical protein
LTGHDAPAVQLDEPAEQFLTIEFESQREMRGSLNALVAAESNIFVAIVAATFVGLSFLGQATVRDTGVDYAGALYLAAVGVLLVNYLLGWSTFRRVISSRATVVRYARSMNRTRRYYVDRYPDLAPLVSPDIYDDRPPMGSVGSNRPFLDVLSGNTGLVAILASACLGALIGVGIAAAVDAGHVSRSSVESGRGAILAIGVVLGTFLGSMLMFERYATRRFAAEEAAWTSHFPKPPSSRRGAASRPDDARG